MPQFLLFIMDSGDGMADENREIRLGLDATIIIVNTLKMVANPTLC